MEGSTLVGSYSYYIHKHTEVATTVENRGEKSSGVKMDKKTRLTFHEKVAFVWFVIDSFTHLSIELGYVWLALTTTAAKSDTYLGHIWREYGRADARWAVRDPNVISIEVATVAIGVLCVFQVYGVLHKSAWRHPLQILICVAELYGGWMTFAPGSPRICCISYTSITNFYFLSLRQ